MSLAIDGLASGLDTSSIVNQLMEIERRPIKLLEVRQSEMQQRMDAWRDINSRLNRLDNLMADLARTSTYEGRKATSADEAIVTAIAANRVDPAVYTVDVEQLATAHRIGITGTGLAEFTGTIQINGTEITIEAGMSLQELATAIRESDADVHASVIADTLVLESKSTGLDGAIVIEAFDGDSSPVQLGVTELQAAQDAQLTINGVEGITSGSNSITGVVEGITFQLHEVGTTTITVAQDVDGAVSRVQAFVDQYNSAMEFMRERLGEGAILQGDSMLIRLQMGLRQAVLDRVATGGELNQLAQVGMTSTREGRLEFDQAEFREAFQEDPVAVKTLFAGDGEQDGAIDRTRGFLKSYIESQTGIIAGRQDMLDDQVSTIKDNIERMEDRLERRAERLYRQFTAMEQALAQMQNQSNWLQMQLAQFAPANTGG